MMVKTLGTLEGVRTLVESTAGATGFLANVLLFAFFAVRASHPEVGTSLGQRSGVIGIPVWFLLLGRHLAS